MPLFQSLRSRKEAFVSNLTGSSLSDVLYVTTLPSVLVVLFMCLASFVPIINSKRRPRGRQLAVAVMEMLLIVSPQVLQLTSLDADHLLFKWTCVATASAMVLTWLCGGRKGQIARGGSLGSHPLLEQEQRQDESRRSGDFAVSHGHPGVHGAGQKHGGGNQIDHANDSWIPETFKRIQDAVSMHRANVMIMTCLAILAVDFRAFPRKYAKTEFYGTSLMDAGVGSIILCSSFVEGLKVMGSSRYRAKEKQNRLKETSLRSLARILVLVLLGVGRPLSLWLIGYQVHEGEYGMHWNFFLTLAVMRAAISNVPRSSSPLIIGVMLLVAHQYGLSSLGMADLVNDTSFRRHAGLLYQNKEGLVSLTGYLALHFLGVWCAKVYAYLNSRPRHPIMQGWNTLHAFGVSMLWVAFWYARTYVERESRRSCNAAFILWMLAINCQAILFNTLCLNAVSMVAGARIDAAAGWRDGRTARKKVFSAYLPPLYNAVNRGMLYVFLWANLSTGAVNAWLVKDTLGVEDGEARRVLILHMTLIVAFATLVFGG